MSLRHRASAMILAPLLACVALLGCPGTLADKECFLQEARAAKILAASCIDGGCHSAKDKAIGLDLESPGLTGRLKGIKSTTCNGGDLVVAGDPDKSVLYEKLSEAPPCGSRMPLGKPGLYPEDVEVLRVWIAGMDGSCASAGGTGGAGGTSSTGGMSGGGTGGSGGTPSGGSGGGM